MENESRMTKSLKNARVSTFFYFVFLILSFFSRKIFLEHLGDEFIGLTGTLGNILGFMNLAELGVGTATAYNLYKPIQEGNKERINELVSVFGFLYRKIGLVILGIGIAVSAFFPLIFKNVQFPMLLVYASFYAFLSSALIGYFINYRQVLLSADQKGYVVTAYLQTANFLKVILQMTLALIWGNLYVWVSIELVFSVIACIILNIRIDKEYPWLEANVKIGKKALPENRGLITNIKQIFVHKFSAFVLKESDQILIYAFVSLKMVAYYGNYTIIIDKLSQAVGSALNSFYAGVGSLVAEGDKDKMQKVFWEIHALRFLIAGIIVFCVYFLIEPFIGLWVGSRYVLGHKILILLLCTVFIDQVRGPIDMFKDGFGLFADTWAPVAETLINITVTLSTAPFIGISGILLGKIASTVLIVCIWKPYYLYKHGFGKSVASYWKEYAKYAACLAVSIVASHFILRFIDIDPGKNFLLWFVYALLTFLVFFTIYFGLLYASTNGMRAITVRFLMALKKN